MRLDELTLQGLADELPHLSPANRVLLIAGQWFVFLVLGFLLFWMSGLETNSALDQQIQQSLERLDNQSSLLLDAPKIEAELAELEAQLPVLKMALPTERELAALLERVNAVILDHQLKLAQFTPETPLNQEVMRVVPVKLTVRGQGEHISKLPNQIAALSRQVSLKTFEMSVVESSGDWQMTGQLNAFAQLPANLPPVQAIEPQPEEDPKP